ncbi:unnamed protein product [Oikopleura dioica]|uniref:Gamma-glutamylcyclotransferase family protein n=1 Tax=Oikopleura dioica TaxID=34765 RepID=E4XNA6_OIKDI|nr:unnamed protein product [Oikopleura dioica]
MEKLEGKIFISEAKTVKKFPLVVATECGIPALLKATGSQGERVSGELWDIPEKMVPIVDEFEAHPELYTRLNEEVERKDTGEIVSAGIYFIEQPKEELLNLPSYAIYNEGPTKAYNGSWNKMTVQERKDFLISKMKNTN